MEAYWNGMRYTPVKRKGPRKKIWLYILIGVLCAAIIGSGAYIAYIVLDSYFSAQPENSDYKKYSLAAYIDKSGNAYFVSENGKITRITVPVVEATMTADREHIVALGDDDRLYVFDGDGKNEIKTSENLTEICAVRDGGVIFADKQLEDVAVEDVLHALTNDYNAKYDTAATYEDVESYFSGEGWTWSVEDALECYEYNMFIRYEDKYNQHNTYYRYLFADGYTTMISNEVASCDFAGVSLNFLFAAGDSIYALMQTDTAARKLYSAAGDYVDVLGISDSGVAVWTDTLGTDTSVFSSSGGDTKSLGEFATDYEFSGESWVNDVCFINNESEIIVANMNSETILYGSADGAVSRALYLGDSTFIFNYYSSEGEIFDGTDGPIDAIYTSIPSGDAKDIYRLELDGNREKIVSGVSSFIGTYGGSLYYIEGDGTLCMLDLNSGGGTEELASDVDAAFIMNDGILLFYKDYVQETGIATIYCISPGEKAEKIASSAFSPICLDGKATYRTDYKTIDPDRVLEDYEINDNRCGSLYLFDRSKSTLIATDVAKIEYVGNSAMAFVFLQYDHLETDDRSGVTTVYCTLCYYDGDNVTTVTNDIIYTTYSDDE